MEVWRDSVKYLMVGLEVLDFLNVKMKKKEWKDKEFSKINAGLNVFFFKYKAKF